MDHLLARGAECVTVLDISSAALDRARQRLGDDASRVHWLVADVTGDWQVQPVDIWHDRAVFHFSLMLAINRGISRTSGRQ